MTTDSTARHEQSGPHGMGRRAFLKTAALWTGLGALTVFEPRRTWAGPDQPMNVVFFLVDDMGWMDSTVYGSRYYETPNMERLARMSTRFMNAYVTPLCTATRAGIITGQYPGRLHITGASGHVPVPPGPLMAESGPPHQEIIGPRCQGFLPLEEYTLGNALQDAGYRTGFIGKWHLGHDPQYWPEHQGFDINIGGGRWPGPPSYFSPYRIDNLPDGPEGEYITDRLTDEGVRFIRESKDQPFFLNFWQYAIHAPYQGKIKYQEYFEEKQDPRGAQHNAVMGAMIKSLDESLGRLMDTLEEEGLMDNTIIIFTSDDGGNMYDRTDRDGTNLGAWAPEGRMPTNNAPLRGGKGSVYEGGIRVPAMIYWPGVADEEAVSYELVNCIDYYPTLLDMLGIEPHPDTILDGVSIVPALQGEPLERDTIFGHFPHGPQAVPCQMASWVRQGDWKLIRFYVQDENFPDRLELYNLREDIGELYNLAATMPDKAAELEALLDEHLEEIGALVPFVNPNYDPNALTECDGWRPSGDAALERGDGTLIINSIGGDPFIHRRGDVPPVEEPFRVRFRARSDSEGEGMLFWAVETAPNFGPHQRIEFPMHHDDAWHEYAIDVTPAAPLIALRLDPSTAPGRIEIDWIRMEDADGALIKEWDFANDSG